MKTIFHILAVAALAVAFVTLAPIFGAFVSAALAQEPGTKLVIPYGDMLGQLASVLAWLAAAALMFAMRTLPAQIVAVIKTARVDQLLEKAIIYGINSTVDAVKGQSLNVDVGNKVLAQALQYVVDHAPGWIVAWMGGEDMIKQKLVARLDLDAKAAL